MKITNYKLPLIVGSFLFTVLAGLNDSTNIIGSFAEELSEADIHEVTCAKDFNDVTDRPVITVLTHGLGGSAADWSNDYNSSMDADDPETLNFCYDGDSLISKIKELNPDTKLYRIDKEGKIFSEYSNEALQKNEDIIFTSHTIIVPDYDSWASIPKCYELFNKSIDSITYLYKNKHSGVLPKLNLIGHSMGGIINMKYTIDHPKNVDTLLSIGTPYNGSTLDTDFVYSFNPSFGEQRCINANCGHHECDLEVRKNLWNETYKANKHINFYAFSGETAGSFIEKLALTYDIGKYINPFAGCAAIAGTGLAPWWFAGTVLPVDFCVDVDSQKATGYDGVTNFNKIYSAFNSNIDKKNRNMISIPHNLEPHDEDTIKCITNIIDCGVHLNHKKLGNSNIGVELISEVDDGCFLKITNKTGIKRSFVYNSKKCLQIDAAALSGLEDLQFTDLVENNGSTIIKVENNVAAKYFVISYENNWTRNIIYFNDDFEELKTNQVGIKNVFLSGDTEIQLICSNYNGKWSYKITNNSTKERTYFYNEKLCFQDDGFNWTNDLHHVSKTKLLMPGESALIVIEGNGFADYFSISYVDNAYRYVICGPKGESGSIKQIDANIIYVPYYSQKEIGVRILGHANGGWYVEICNNSNEQRVFEYNFETTDEESAKWFGGLSKIYQTKVLAHGEKELVWIEDSDSYITISYTKDYKRYIFYADDLNNDGSLREHDSGNEKDESVIIKNDGFFVEDEIGYYNVTVENYTGKDRIFFYEDSLCREDFAATWSDYDINYVVNYIKISKGGSETLKIRKVRNLCFTISYIENNVRHIYYTKDLHTNHHISTTFVNEVPVHESNDKDNKIAVSVVGKHYSTWLISLRNISGARKEFSYFKKFTGYTNLTGWNDTENTLESVYLDNNETKILEIQKSDSEAFIWFGISYLSGSDRKIFIGSNPSFSSPLETDGYTLDNSFRVSIINKNGSTWNLKVTNNTGSSRTIFYNSKMCFEDDAKNWDNLSDVAVLSFGNGQTRQVQISENGMATSVCFCYINGNTRNIYYSRGLSKTGGIICYRTTKYLARNVKSDVGFGASIIGKNGSTWLISITNNTGTSRSFEYNSKMCFESDAKDWNNICDIKTSPTISNGSSLENCIQISENGFAGTIVISYLNGNTRKIYYAYNLSTACTLSAYTNTKDESFKVDVVSKSGGTWRLRVTNRTGAKRLIVYNSKMCFESDAKNWSGLTDANYLWLSNNSSTTISISENGTARFIAVSYISGSTRYILYANGIYTDGRISSYRSSKGVSYYTRNGMKAGIIGKNGSKWLISLTNNTGASRSFEYNTKMCFEGDAKNWSGLSDTTSLSLTNGGDPAIIGISENGFAGTIAISYMDGSTRKIFYAYDLSNSSGTMSAYESSSTSSDSQCVAKGTLITLADGTQKKVEDLTGDELLLAWNMETGEYEASPILFVDSDPQAKYEVITLSFSDGTKVDVISEHGFFDITLGKYVYLDKDAEKYIGHKFLKQSEDFFSEVTLVDVKISKKVTTTYSPVTYGTLCYFVNGMLSMPGGITGLFNYFEVDTNTMMYDKKLMEQDIEQYGLLSYEELCEFAPVSREMFDAVNGKYLNIALGKGLLTMDDVMAMAERYSVFVPDNSSENYNIEEQEDIMFSSWLKANQKEIVDVINDFMQSYTGMYWMRISYSDFKKIDFKIVNYSECVFKATFVWGNSVYTLTMKGIYK